MKVCIERKNKQFMAKSKSVCSACSVQQKNYRRKNLEKNNEIREKTEKYIKYKLILLVRTK